MQKTFYPDEVTIREVPATPVAVMVHRGDPAAIGATIQRFAESHGVARDEFLRHYQGSELDPNWMERVGTLGGKGWKNLAEDFDE